MRSWPDSWPDRSFFLRLCHSVVSCPCIGDMPAPMHDCARCMRRAPRFRNTALCNHCVRLTALVESDRCMAMRRRPPATVATDDVAVQFPPVEFLQDAAQNIDDNDVCIGCGCDEFGNPPRCFLCWEAAGINKLLERGNLWSGQGRREAARVLMRARLALEIINGKEAIAAAPNADEDGNHEPIDHFIDITAFDPITIAGPRHRVFAAPGPPLNFAGQRVGNSERSRAGGASSSPVPFSDAVP